LTASAAPVFRRLVAFWARDVEYPGCFRDLDK
jgi:hypothetical protein